MASVVLMNIRNVKQDKQLVRHVIDSSGWRSHQAGRDEGGEWHATTDQQIAPSAPPLEPHQPLTLLLLSTPLSRVDDMEGSVPATTLLQRVPYCQYYPNRIHTTF